MDLLRTLLYKVPSAKFCLKGNSLEELEWHDDRPIPALKELEAAYEEMVALGIDPLKGEDWDALRDKLNTSPIFLKIYSLAKQSLAVQMAFQMVMQVVLVTKIRESLQFYLNDLKTELGTNLTSEDLAKVNQDIKECGFRFEV